MPTFEQFHHPTNLFISCNDFIGPIVLASLHNLSRIEAEQEEVLVSGFLANLDIGTVERSDRKRSVHHELHVAGA